jgi:hypothetical protein
VAFNQTFLPASHGELTPLIERCLVDRGYRSSSRGVRIAGAPVPTARPSTPWVAPGFAPPWLVSSWECRIPGSAIDLAVIEMHAIWDLALIRRLSAQTGGFAVAVDSVRTEDRYGFAVFYAGHTLELHTRHQLGQIDLGAPAPDPPWDPVRDHRRALESMCRGRLVELQPTDGSPLPWIAIDRSAPGGDPYLLDPSDERPLCRVILPGVDGRSARRVMTTIRTGEDWRLQEARGPLTDLPYVMIERPGVLPVETIAAIATGLDCLAAGVGLGGGPQFAWLTCDPGNAPSSGQALGADAFIRVLSFAMVAIGECAAAVRWPAVREPVNPDSV